MDFIVLTFFVLKMGDTASSTFVPVTHRHVQPWENPSSPYFLTSSDNPGVSLVVEHLTEENYNTWSRAILISLDAKTKIGFVDGSIPKPQSPDHPCYIAWCKCNSIVLAWLFNSISKDLQHSVVYFKTAREVWVDLEFRFSQGNGPRIFELRKRLVLWLKKICLSVPITPNSRAFGMNSLPTEIVLVVIKWKIVQCLF